MDLHSSTDKVTVKAGLGYCIYNIVADRKCALFPELDYDKSVSTSHTNQFPIVDGSCWDNKYPQCDEKYRKTVDC